MPFAETVSGVFESYPDTDWYAIDLVAGSSHVFRASGNYAVIEGIYDSDGNALAGATREAIYRSINPRDSYFGVNSAVAAHIDEAGTYYVAVKQEFSPFIGNYTLTSEAYPEDDILDTTATTAVIEPGVPFEGQREFDWDRDWIAADVEANAVYTLRMNDGLGGYLSGIRINSVFSADNVSSAQFYFPWNDDIAYFVPENDGRIFIKVEGGFFNSTLGPYEVFLDQIIAPSPGIIAGAYDETDQLIGTEASEVLINIGNDSYSMVDSLVGMGGADTLIGAPSLRTTLFFGDAPAAAYLYQLSEDAAAQIFRLYQIALDRDPDVMGFYNWTLHLESLGGYASNWWQIASSFVESPEFTSRFSPDLSNAEFVTLLYNNAFDNDPDDQGLARWVGDLEAGASRAQVVVDIANSPQFIAQTESMATRYINESQVTTWSDDVFRLYQATLNRSPDQQGMDHWTGNLADGTSTLEQVAAGFVGSPEFTARFSASSNTDFVTLLYNNMLGSTPDDAGLARWVADLEGGASRESVVLGFSQSPQFTMQTTEAVKTWMRDQGLHDRIDAGEGTNLVAGGQYADVFEFTAGETSATRVLDFEAWDYLQLKGFGYDTLEQAKAQMTQTGADVTFADQEVEVVLMDTMLDEIQLDTFLDTFQIV